MVCSPRSNRPRRGPSLWVIAIASCLGCAGPRSGIRESPAMLGQQDDPSLALARAKTRPGAIVASPGRLVATPAPRLAPDTVRTTARPASGGAGRARPVAIALVAPPTANADPTTDEQPGRMVTSPKTPRSPEAAEPDAPTLESVIALARSRVDALESYRVKLDRRERVGEALTPPESLILSIHRSPQAVRLEWPSGPDQGRDVIYRSPEAGGDGKLHIKTGKALLGRITLPLDNPLIARSGRHPITEAGFDSPVATMEHALKLQRAGAPEAGRFAYEGRGAGPGGRPCDKITRRLPNGENWLVQLDASTHLPALVRGVDANGQLLEEYTFSDPILNPTILASADAFDPDRCWGPSGGLFNRMARSNEGTTATANPSPR